MSPVSSAGAAIAKRILGEAAHTLPIAGTLHTISSWSDGQRRIVIKEYPQAIEPMEARVYRAIDGTGIAPRLLESGPGHVVIDWFPGRTLLETTAAVVATRPALLRAAASAIAELHRRCADLGAGPDRGPLPGPYGFVHGDALPHNLLVDAEERLVLIDFDKAGHGPRYLDLIPLLAVLPTAEALALLRLYHDRVGDALIPEYQAAFVSLLRDYPAIRLRRLRDQAREPRFAHCQAVFARLDAWLSCCAAVPR